MELLNLENLRRLDENLRRLIRANSEEEYDPEFAAYSEIHDELVIDNLPRNCRERDILQFMTSNGIHVVGKIHFSSRPGRARVPVTEKFRALRILDRVYFDHKKLEIH